MRTSTKDILALAQALPESQPFSNNLLRAQEELMALARERDGLRAKLLGKELDQPLDAVDRLRLWHQDPDTFDPIDLDDAEEILALVDKSK